MRSRKREDNGFEEWGGYMEAKKTKLEEQYCLDVAKNSAAINEDGIFKNIAIFVNGYTIPSADELKLLMMKHGGIYHHYYRSEKTTHIIASNLPDTKIKQLKTTKVVKPEWIVDSIAKGKLQDYKQYLLYTNQSRTQPKLFLHPQKVQTASNSLEISSTDTTEHNIESVNPKQFSNYEECIKEEGNVCKISEAVEHKEIPKTYEVNKQHNLKYNVKKTASEVSFLSEFYSNSRLHHISTMGAIFKQYVSSLRANNSGSFKGVNNFKEWLSRQPRKKQIENFDDELVSFDEKGYKSVIMHIDMDCFFVSVGLKKRPDLKGHPVAVTHAKANSHRVKREGTDRNAEFNLYKERAEGKSKLNKFKKKDCSLDQTEVKPWSDKIESISETDSMSEISSCNYEARKAGLKNGMFLGQALKLCPNLRTIPYDFEAYKEVSYLLYDTVASFTLNIEAVSCDEMFADCTELLSVTSADPMELASFLRQEIKDKTGCSCSTGFGSNRLQARLATRKAKPDGQFYLAPEAVMEFMKAVKVSDLPGVGRAINYKLSQLSVNTCLDLQKMPLTKLQTEFGKKTGHTLYKNCRGLDDKTLMFCQVRKSVSAEVNYGIRFENQTEADNFLEQLSTEVHSRLQEVNKVARCVTLKLMVKAKDAPEETAKFLGHGVCDHTTRSSTLATPTSDINVILREVLLLSKQLKINPRELRGIGIQLSRLEDVSKHNICKDGIDKFLVPKVAGFCTNKQEKHFQKTSNSAAQKDNSCINNYFKLKKSSKEMKKPEIGKSLQINSVERTLDKDVLNALPEDIRQEVLEEYGCVLAAENKNEIKVPNSLSPVSADLNKNPVRGVNTQSPKTLMLDDKADGIDETKPLNTDLTLTEIRTLIREWVSSEESPLLRDVIMLSDYLEQLVMCRQLENLDIAIKCLYRCVANRKSEEWQNAYFIIVNSIQDVMITIYGAKLFVQDNFTCHS